MSGNSRLRRLFLCLSIHFSTFDSSSLVTWKAAKSQFEIVRNTRVPEKHTFKIMAVSYKRFDIENVESGNDLIHHRIAGS